MDRLRRQLICAVPAVALCALPAVADDTLWTQEPTRIDKSKQHFERLPPLTKPVDGRIWLQVSERIVVLDSVRFSMDDKVYRIGGIHPVKPRRICKQQDGSRWHCGRMAAINLGNLVRGNRLLCDVTADDKETILSNCLSKTRNIGTEIVARGYGRADGEGPLAEIQLDAQRNGSGLWRNPACKIDFDNC
ncbi:hypothetical protein JJB09_00765 [Rhizobium sp. KVB221]|uniref:Nuclease n=1 Tax=Rhizobium setariae TaxID=2801340 RepID=A0A936YPT2_9HYPH|nr:hypothetical protein [Rhizobium setariae]MBL0370546.1 hypothetical protein [Rhizobium setariae]